MTALDLGKSRVLETHTGPKDLEVQGILQPGIPAPQGYLPPGEGLFILALEANAAGTGPYHPFCLHCSGFCEKPV